MLLEPDETEAGVKDRLNHSSEPVVPVVGDGLGDSLVAAGVGADTRVDEVERLGDG